MTSKIKKCPFCGSSAEIIHYSEELFGIMKYARVRCRVCGSRGPQIEVSLSYSADDKAVEAWNRRSDQDRPPDMYKDNTTCIRPAKDMNIHDVLKEIELTCANSGANMHLKEEDMAELTIWRRIKRK